MRICRESADPLPESSLRLPFLPICEAIYSQPYPDDYSGLSTKANFVDVELADCPKLRAWRPPSRSEPKRLRGSLFDPHFLRCAVQFRANPNCHTGLFSSAIFVDF